MFDALTAEERKQALDACEIIKTVGRASVSCLQRRMRLGYIQAAHIVDCLEEEGIVGLPNDGALRPIFDDKLEEALSQPNAGGEGRKPASERIE